MPFRHIFLDKTYRSAWSRTLQLWKPLALWTLLVWLMFTLLIVPATIAFIHFGFIRGDRLVLSNEEILSFLLTPTGILFLFLIGSAAIIATIVRFAGIFQIVTCQMKRRPITVKELVVQTAPTIPRMLRLSLFSILLALFIALFLLLGVAVVYWIFLSGQDINYYLTVQPPEWTYALISGGIWLLFSAGIALYVVGRISIALPAFLDCTITIREAIHKSWLIMGARSVKLLQMVLGTFAIWFLLLMITEAILLTITGFTIDQVSAWVTHPRAVTSIAGLYFITSQLLTSVIGFFGFSFITVLLTKFYHDDSGLKETAPPAPNFSELKRSISRNFDRVYTPVRAGLLVLLLLSAGFGTGAFLAASIPASDEVKILAHRTGPPPAPENTLAALELAIEQGADIAEIDVMQTQDGTVVVFHDRDMMRMARDRRRIENVTYADIAELVQIPDGGFPPEERRIATLEEMLLRGKDRIGFMIELKYYDFNPRLADEVIRIVKETGMEDQVSIASLQLDPLRDLLRSGSNIETGYISAISIGNLVRLPVQYIAVQHQQINGALIRSAREYNIEVYAWTVNSPERVAAMINLGVDGIITDFPDMAAEVARSIQDLTLPERQILNITGWQPGRFDTVGDAETIRPE